MTLNLILAMMTLIGCDGGGSAVPTHNGVDDLADTAPDDAVPPAIDHSPVDGAWSISEDMPIQAVVLDEDSSILLVQVHYRKETNERFNSRGLVLAPPPEDGVYEGSIPSADMGTAGMHYYIEAVDAAGNTGLLPESAPDDFYRVDLVD